MILLVDDQAADLRLYTRLLLEARYSCLAVESGEAAIAALQEHPEISLIFMDIVMPGMSGIEAAARIRDLTIPICGVPIVGVTGYDPEMHPDAAKLPAARFDAMLRKPVPNREILDAVLKWS